MDATPESLRIEEDLDLLASLDPAPAADLAARIADNLGRALDSLDEGQPD